MHRIPERQGDTAFWHIHLLRIDIVHTLPMVSEAESPAGLDAAWRGVVDHVDDRLTFAGPDGA